MNYTLQNVPSNITTFKDWLTYTNTVGNDQVFNLLLIGSFLFFYLLFSRFVDAVTSLIYSGLITAILGVLLLSIGGLLNETIIMLLILAGGVGLVISYLSKRV